MQAIALAYADNRKTRGDLQGAQHVSDLDDDRTIGYIGLWNQLRSISNLRGSGDSRTRQRLVRVLRRDRLHGVLEATYNQEN